MSFSAAYPLRFAHCDMAGIAYYPRLFELVDAAVEDWTAATLGMDRRTMHGDLGLGLPTVDLHADFIAPARLGETLDIAVVATRLGDSSAGFRIEATVDGAPRFTVRATQVLMHLGSKRPHPWPDDLRRRIAAILEPEAPE
jgi:4-hydroxybenzoyl-CoA thioesterase